MARFKLAGAIILLAGFLAFPAKAADMLDQRKLIADSTIALQRLYTNEQLKPALELLKRARAVMVFPSLLKGALFIGGEGGSGVLLARGADGSWSYPAFYTLGSVSFGFQVGGQSSEAVLIVMNDKALTALMGDQVKIGGDLSAAAGPVGTGIEASATTSLGEDIYTYSSNKGLFIGASFEGAVIARREDWNGEFYNGVSAPNAIVLERKVSNPLAEPLRTELDRHNAN
jgi:lipid-binding SYLF domain-containing protein